MLTHTGSREHEIQRLINLLASYGIREPILSAFEQVPRDKFIGQKFAHAAFEDHALPIGEGQTISQPSLVAAMLQALELKGGEKVLEVGTGSGFQTALLTKLAKDVYSIERVQSLAQKAKKRIKKLGLKNMTIITGDGTQGYEEGAPYDAVIVTAYFKDVPRPLVRQLKEGGKLVMPVGEEDWQEVILYEKQEGKLKEVKRVAPVRFVPLIGKYGWEEK